MQKISDEKGLLSCREAIAKIVSYVGTEFESKQVLADGLHSDRLRLVVDYVWEGKIEDMDDFTPKKRGLWLYEENTEIETGFFSKSMQWPRETGFWRWDEDKFVLFHENELEATTCIYLMGVRFIEKEVVALVGRSGRSGGPKSDRERWAMFWINVLWDFCEDFDWTQFDNPHQLKQAFLRANDTDLKPGTRLPFSENNIDFAVELAWEHLARRAAREAVQARLGPVSEE